MQVFERHIALPFPAGEVYDACTRTGSFERLMPPWKRFRVLEQSGFREGGRVVFDAGSGPLRRRRVLEFTDFEPGLQFSERQARGPFVSWRHTQRFLSRGQQSCELIDHVEYELPGKGLSGFGASAVSRRLERLFRFRQARICNDMAAHREWATEPRLRVAIAGASGLLGSQLAAYLGMAGHDVLRLVRRPTRSPDEVFWDPQEGRLDARHLVGVDAVINLAGVSLATVWTARKREALVQSRLCATRTLAAAMQRMETPPTVFVSASAVGAYGSRGGEALTEESPLGTGFLAELCQGWEAAAASAALAGVRVVTPRFGIVLSGSGGALAALLPVFRAGLGARIGNGWQWWSWVALDDALGAIEWALHDTGMCGAVNVVAPQAVTNRDFTRTLGKVVRRPAALEVPRPAAERLGGMPREMLLASQRAAPMRLREAGYRFTFPDLESALRFQLGE